jgi:hypothetical protein
LQAHSKRGRISVRFCGGYSGAAVVLLIHTQCRIQKLPNATSPCALDRWA